MKIVISKDQMKTIKKEKQHEKILNDIFEIVKSLKRVVIELEDNSKQEKEQDNDVTNIYISDSSLDDFTDAQ